jgi:LysM repeat protein
VSGQKETIMKWKHWSILIILVLLNYIIFSTAFSIWTARTRPGSYPTRTPHPTFESVEPTPLAWIVLPTSTPRPTKTPAPETPTPVNTIAVEVDATAMPTTTAEIAVTDTPPPATGTPEPTGTPVPPTTTPSAELIAHRVRRGETLWELAMLYGVTIRAIADANGLADPSLIITGQTLVIPEPGQTPPPPTAVPTPASTAAPTRQPPTPKPTQKPPTATSTRPPPTLTPSPAASAFQFTAKVIWDPMVAPNCSGPAISRQSVVQDTSGNPVNGVRIEVDCYGNKWLSHPTGNPGEYDAGHYDFSFGQSTPQDWTCTARVFEMNGQPVTSSEAISIQFDTNDCRPYGIGHQVAIVNWTRHW